MTWIQIRLAFAGMRQRRLQSALTVIVVAASAAALTVAVGVGRVVDDPWARTFEATNGPHVLALAMQPRTDMRPLEREPGVTQSTGVLPLVFSGFRHNGKRFGIQLIGVSSKPPLVARPIVDAGRWAQPGGIVLERSFAHFLGLEVGDRLVVGSPQVPVRVAGIAIVSQSEPYPRSQPGRAFALEETLARIQPDRLKWSALLGLRLADPDTAAAFANRATRELPGVVAEDWTADRADVRDNAKTVRIILSIFTILLLLSGGAVLATLIGGRVLAQQRELGLLKAVGLTPPQLAQIVLIEQLALGLAGAAVGLAAGTLATPLFVGESASLLDASEVPPVTVGAVLTVLAIVLGCVSLFALGPSFRAGRRTTASLLTQVSPGSRQSRLGRLATSLGLPLPIVVGARDAFSHRGRATLTVLSLALTVASVVATLGMEASLNDSVIPPQTASASLEAFGPDPVNDDTAEAAQLRPIVYGLDGVLLFVWLANLLATVLLGLRERVRDLGLLKAVGLTPKQVAGTFLAAQGLLAAAAGLVGIPLGLLLFRGAIQADGSGSDFSYPQWWWLVLVAPGTVLIVLALGAPLAQRAASIRVMDALRYE
jgi:putative ABC transport system permease protein